MGKASYVLSDIWYFLISTECERKKKDADKADKDKKSKKLSAEDFKALAAFFGVMILSGVVVYLIKKKNGNKQK